MRATFSARRSQYERSSVTTIRLFLTLMASAPTGLGGPRGRSLVTNAITLQALFEQAAVRIDCASVYGTIPAARFGYDNRLRGDMARNRNCCSQPFEKGWP
jgi:hypothetical protein